MSCQAQIRHIFLFVPILANLTHLHTYTHTHTHTYILTYTHTHTHTYLYTYLYTHKHAGTTPQSCNTLYWQHVQPLALDLCNADPVLPTSLVVPLSNLTYLQNGHQYFVTLRAISGAQVSGSTPSSSFIFISALPSHGEVFEISVKHGPYIWESVSVADDIDFQSDTCCLLIQWTLFVHAFDQNSVLYSVQLFYDGEVRWGLYVCMYACM